MTYMQDTYPGEPMKSKNLGLQISTGPKSGEKFSGHLGKA